MMETQTVRYPNVHVELSGSDGNAFAVLGKVRQALTKGGVNADDLLEFMEVATMGDYDHLLATVMDWVEVS